MVWCSLVKILKFSQTLKQIWFNMVLYGFVLFCLVWYGLVWFGRNSEAEFKTINKWKRLWSQKWKRLWSESQGQLKNIMPSLHELRLAT